MDLSGSNILTKFTAELYPAMREVVEKDSAVVAIPVEYSVDMPAYNPEAFAALGLTEDDVPTNWMEFLQFLQRLPKLIEGTDFTAFDQYASEDSVACWILEEIIKAYELYLECDDSAGMCFDSAILRALLEEYEKIDFTQLGAARVARDDSIISDEKYMLFQFGVSATCDAFYAWGTSRKNNVHLMPLSLNEEMEPMIWGIMYVAFVNPYSENVEAAVRYLEAAVDGMPEKMRANLIFGWSEPVKSDDADEKLTQKDDAIATLEEEVKNAAGDDKVKYEEMLDAKKEERQRYVDSWYWLISADDLERYQSYAGKTRIWNNFGLDISGEDILSDLLSQYLDGVIDADTLLKSLDKKVTMMLMEEN